MHLRYMSTSWFTLTLTISLGIIRSAYSEFRTKHSEEFCSKLASKQSIRVRYSRGTPCNLQTLSRNNLATSAAKNGCFNPKKKNVNTWQTCPPLSQ